MKRVFLSIGSNLLNPFQQVNIAINYLTKLPETKLEICSSYYRSKPLGKKKQPDFLNAVLILNTKLLPEILLKYIQEIELKLGRVRNKIRWGPRTLDLDILLFENYLISTTKLTIPHYDIYNREFVLYPLKEISPHLQFPDGSKLSHYLSRIEKNSLSLWKNN